MQTETIPNIPAVEQNHIAADFQVAAEQQAPQSEPEQAPVVSETAEPALIHMNRTIFGDFRAEEYDPATGDFIDPDGTRKNIRDLKCTEKVNLCQAMRGVSAADLETMLAAGNDELDRLLLGYRDGSLNPETMNSGSVYALSDDVRREEGAADETDTGRDYERFDLPPPDRTWGAGDADTGSDNEIFDLPPPFVVTNGWQKRMIGEGEADYSRNPVAEAAHMNAALRGAPAWVERLFDLFADYPEARPVLQLLAQFEFPDLDA